MTQKAAYPTPPAMVSKIQGRHNGVALNFHAKTPRAIKPKMMAMALAIVISILCVPLFGG